MTTSELRDETAKLTGRVQALADMIASGLAPEELSSSSTEYVNALIAPYYQHPDDLRRSMQITKMDLDQMDR